MPFSLWTNPDWSDTPERARQLDDHIRHTGKAGFGLRTFDETRKINAVIDHFNSVAEKYDFMNSLLSFGIQHVWKREAVRMLALKPGSRVLDVCGGTGDLAELASERIGPEGSVIIYDINRKMMVQGLKKQLTRPRWERIDCVQGNAETIAFPSQSFDAAMVGFGIRNLTHLEKGFKEMHRVLKPGGKLLCLEFSKPKNPLFRALYDFYSFNVMPMMGQLITGSARPYACLPETIRMFPLPDELSDILKTIGFKDIQYRSMTNGIAVAHVGIKG